MIGKTKEKHPGNASNMQDGADTKFFTLQFFFRRHLLFFFSLQFFFNVTHYFFFSLQFLWNWSTWTNRVTITHRTTKKIKDFFLWQNRTKNWSKWQSQIRKFVCNWSWKKHICDVIFKELENNVKTESQSSNKNAMNKFIFGQRKAET